MNEEIKKLKTQIEYYKGNEIELKRVITEKNKFIKEILRQKEEMKEEFKRKEVI